MKSKLLMPNSTQIPNVILDKIIPLIPQAEARCLLYICRRTYGFQKEKDRISLTQFVAGIRGQKEILDYGTGLTRASVIKALKNLEKVGLISSFKDQRIGNSYALNCGILVDKYVEKGMVNELCRLSHYTKGSIATIPKVVKLLYPQNKGNKGNIVIIENKKNEDEKTKAILEGKRELAKKFNFQRV